MNVGTCSRFFFSRNVFIFVAGGGITFVGRENAKNIQKNKQNLFMFGGGGGDLKLKGDISPPKGPEKITAHAYLI